MADSIAHGAVECLLPSGWRVRVVLPSLRHLVRHGILPTHLHEAALKGADPAWLSEPEHREERQARVGEYVSFLVAHSLRESCAPDGEWRAESLTAADVLGMDELDLDLLEDLVLRERTADEVTARSRILRGESPDEAEEVGTLAWDEFRVEPRSAESGEDSESMDDAPVAAAVGER